LRAGLAIPGFETAWREGREWVLAQAVKQALELFDAASGRQ
jgi:hypothetical protein